MATIGIDIGLDGAIAVLDDDNSIELFDMPVIEIVTNKKLKSGKYKVKREYDIHAIVRILKHYDSDSKTTVYIEKVHSMPAQGVASTFTFGVGLGIIIGLVTALNLAYQLVTPQAWKKDLLAGMQKGKGASVVVGQRLYPEAELTTPKGRKLDGRADALLIAVHGRRLENADT